MSSQDQMREQIIVMEKYCPFCLIFCNPMLKVMDLEDELKMIGENMKALEVAEEKALIREEKYLVK